MAEQGWEADYHFVIALDDRFDRNSDEAVFRPGAEVVALVPETGLLHGQEEKAPPGTKLWGRVYVDPQSEYAKGRGWPANLLVKYDRAKLPGKEEFPVCMIGKTGAVYSMDKDGAVTASNGGNAEVRWFFPNAYYHD